MDLVLELLGCRPWVIEIKRSEEPTLGEGFFKARDDISAERSFVACSAEGHWNRGQSVEVIGVRELVDLLQEEGLPDQVTDSVF